MPNYRRAREWNAPKDWPYSTFHRYVEKEIYSPDWGAIPVEIPIDVGRE
jgi:putative transposase